MEDIIVMVLQFLVEFAFNVLANLPLDLLVEFIDIKESSKSNPPKNDRAPEPKRKTIIAACFAWGFVGCGAAWLSLKFVPHTLIALSALRIANLALAPVTSAWLSEKLAKRRSRRDARIIPRNHFWHAFWFTLGFAAIRFAYATRL